LNNSPGNWLIVLGIAIVVVGLIVKTGLFAWFGNLPGDIEIRREGFRLYVPITSMILVSVGLSLLFAFLRRFL